VAAVASSMEAIMRLSLPAPPAKPKRQRPQQSKPPGGL
jgi:hypothetical protein